MGKKAVKLRAVAAKSKPPAKPRRAQEVRSSKASAPPKRAPGATKSAAPRPPRDAEIVVRQSFVIDATGKGPHAIPEVVFLANASGLAYLSQLFAALAQQARGGDADEAGAILALLRSEPPINARLSDDIDFRFAALTERNRRAMFKRFGIDRASVQKGSLFERYQEVVQHFGRLQGMMRREGLITPPPSTEAPLEARRT